jgi:hypothetical protein
MASGAARGSLAHRVKSCYFAEHGYPSGLSHKPSTMRSARQPHSHRRKTILSARDVAFGEDGPGYGVDHEASFGAQVVCVRLDFIAIVLTKPTTPVPDRYGFCEGPPLLGCPQSGNLDDRLLFNQG